jgi:hypothetical protein
VTVSGVSEKFRLRVSGLLTENGLDPKKVGTVSHEVARLLVEFTRSIDNAAEATGYEDGYRAGLEDAARMQEAQSSTI